LLVVEHYSVYKEGCYNKIL